MIYASHLRRGFVDDPHGRLAWKQIIERPFSWANDTKAQEVDLVVCQRQKQSRRELSNGPEVKAKLSGQRSFQARAYLSLDRAPKEVFCDRLLGMPSPSICSHEDCRATSFANDRPC